MGASGVRLDGEGTDGDDDVTADTDAGGAWVRGPCPAAETAAAAAAAAAAGEEWARWAGGTANCCLYISPTNLLISSKLLVIRMM